MFQPMHPSAFFGHFMSNSWANTELWTDPFIKSIGEDCSNSINRAQVLSYSKYFLLFTCSQDWTCNLQMISPRSYRSKYLYLLSHVSCWKILSKFWGPTNPRSPSTHEILPTITMHDSYLSSYCYSYFYLASTPSLVLV